MIALLSVVFSWNDLAADNKKSLWNESKTQRHGDDRREWRVSLPEGVVDFRNLSQDALDGLYEYLSTFFLEVPSGIPGPPFCFGSTCVDLVPVVVRDDSDQDCSFCQRTALNGQVGLEVSVRNQGLLGADASPTQTGVSYDPGGSIEIPTPSLPAGYSVDLHHLQFIPIPEFCQSGNCQVTICADSDNDIAELNEDNNCVTCFFVP
jgi:hypothetical protein